MAEARALLSLLIAKYFAQPLGKCSGMSYIARVVTGKLYDGCTEALCHCYCATVCSGLSPDTSTSQYDPGQCRRKRCKVEPVAANSQKSVLEESIGVGSPLSAHLRDFNALFSILVVHTALGREPSQGCKSTITAIDLKKVLLGQFFIRQQIVRWWLMCNQRAYQIRVTSDQVKTNKSASTAAKHICQFGREFRQQTVGVVAVRL
jgi:hypothetical protein